MRWETLTSPQIGALDRKLPVILNLAAVEQHGPHLSLETDARIGRLFLDRLDADQPGAQLILPQVQVCCSAHHLDFPGTLSVPHTVLLDYVTAILNSVVKHGFSNLLLFNSHGGNQAIGQVIVEHFGAANPNCRIAMVTWWALVREELAPLSDTGRLGTGHACEFETSLMMASGALAPDAELPPGLFFTPSFAWADGSLLHPPNSSLYRGMKAISGGSGTVGQPDAASREKGLRIVEVVVRGLKTVVADLSRAHQ